MIHTNTVLVLGAGASCPFGLPSGPQLRNRILKSVRKRGERFDSILRRTGADTSLLSDFETGFRESLQTSIDAFLEDRPSFARIGKLLIANELLECESLDTLYSPPLDERNDDDHWLQYLWKHLLGGGAAGFENNRLSIVTFNYDRTVEHALAAAYSGTFGASLRDAVESIERLIPVHHVHGWLGPILERNKEGGVVSNFGSNLSRRSPLEVAGLIDRAAGEIRVVHEASEDDKSLQGIRRLTATAERVIVLGCSFHPENMARIGLASPPDRSDQVRLATGVGLTDLERHEFERRFSLEIGPPEWKSRRFLRERVILDER